MRWRILSCGLVAGMGTALADDASDIAKLLRAGQHSEALAKTDAALGQRPKDPQLRFLKGVILAETNKPTEAIAVFSRLSEDYPELPEPHNNLAVLYAASNQFEKARASLERAIRTNPSYATAYENLGDVHAKLASQAYDKALQLDGGSPTAKSKLTMVRSLVASGPSAAGKIVAAPHTPVPSAPVAKAPAPPAPSAPPAAAPAVNSTEKADPAPAAAKAEPAPAGDDSEREAVIATVKQWARAWSSKDVKGYLAFYAPDFDPPKGMTRKAWSEERQARIAGKGKISVGVESPTVSFKGNTATVKFRQSYVADKLKVSSRKTLLMVKQGGRWLIEQEQTGS